MRRIAATVAMALSLATVFMAVPAQAQPLCNDPVGACDRICRWGIAC